ncbi:MAG: hypoxanthine phosphoribosyltransferase [Desulfobacterales bacterium]|nr:hypoxanthine phosphoribosyltransferase [Desulfobacterales bacterium]
MPAEMVLVLSRVEIAEKVRTLAHRISKDYEGKELCIIGILNGVFIFLADLVREITIPVQIDFVRLASYGSDTTSSGKIRFTKTIELDITDRNVLVVDDIVDAGLTIAYFLEHLKQLNPKSVKVCAFIDKTERRKVHVPIDYAGCVVEHGFLVGYGLDYDEKYRTLPDIYRLKARGEGTHYDHSL